MEENDVGSNSKVQNSEKGTIFNGNSRGEERKRDHRGGIGLRTIRSLGW